MMKVAQHHIDRTDGEMARHACVVPPGEGEDGSLASELRAIDWQALRSRLFATQDRRLPGENLAATRLRLRGSFDGCAAVALTAYDNSKGINLDASSNGKSGHGTSFPVADVNGSGERGLK